MVNSSAKLLATLNLFLLLITTVQSDSFSFNFPRFEPGVESIIVDGDAKTTGGVLQLTKKDQFGKPSPHSVGLSAFVGAIHLSDQKTGKVADFRTEFSFVVNPKGSQLHGDGFTFYLASFDFDFPEHNSDGGFLGLFNETTAFNNSSMNSIVAVEFDSFSNEWDPNFPENSPHIGIDINSIKSVVAAPWPIDTQPEGAIAKSVITYHSDIKELSAFITYPNSRVDVAVSHRVDFSAVLSEWVLVGFSGATGQVAETHDILSWSFTSVL